MIRVIIFIYLISLLIFQVNITFPKSESQRITNVGERKQIVFSNEMRKKHRINIGDKLLVISYPLPNGACTNMLVESNVLNRILSEMTEQIGQILEAHSKEKDNDITE